MTNGQRTCNNTYRITMRRFPDRVSPYGGPSFCALFANFKTQGDGSFVLFLFCLHTPGAILSLLFKAMNRS